MIKRMIRKNQKYHEEQDSLFYKLRSRKKLAHYLFCSSRKLQELSKESALYKEWLEPKKSGGYRLIEAPREDLKAIQRRLSNLLQRLRPPDYLFAPVSGRSYVDNASRHRGARSFRLLDLEDFFQNCTAKRVAWFFRKRMQCSSDVAAVLRDITTRNNHLPQGSPCSPILAYLSYVDMWEEINTLAVTEGCTVSIYADDVTISGGVVREELVWRIKKIMHRYGHRYQRHKEHALVDSVAEITGVIVSKRSLLLPNRQYKKIHDLRNELALSQLPEHTEALMRRLRGREVQAQQILKHNS